MEEEEESEKENDFNSKIVIEICSYIKTKYVFNSNTDPLDLYRDHKLKFPILCHVVKLLFAIPATSVPSEQLFSHAGEVINERRNKLAPELADTLLIISKNMRFIIDDKILAFYE